MFGFYKKCNDRKKCIFIGVATVVGVILGTYGLSQIDTGPQVVTVVDGVYYDKNPWTKHN